MTRFTVVVQRGTAGEIHAADPFAGAIAGEPAEPPGLWWCRPSAPAVVLGSRQSEQSVDVERCARLGLDVVKRRSGGGAVLVDPERMVWADIVVANGVAPDDIRGSMVWAGEIWREALEPWVASGAELVVHRGGMLATPWSELVCFAGLGPGEVLLDGRKLVGLSQRRTRHGMRIQGMLYTGRPPLDLGGLLTGPLPEAPLPEPAVLAVDPHDLIDRLVAGGKWGGLGGIG